MITVPGVCNVLAFTLPVIYSMAVVYRRRRRQRRHYASASHILAVWGI